jgi:hypothetical protein
MKEEIVPYENLHLLDIEVAEKFRDYRICLMEGGTPLPPRGTGFQPVILDSQPGKAALRSRRRRIDALHYAIEFVAQHSILKSQKRG